MRYYPHAENDIKMMLARIGVSELEDLFTSIPSELKYIDQSSVGKEGMWEHELKRDLTDHYFAPSGIRLNFAGAGCYEHFIPSVVDHLTSRSEFITAYTPYQPEASQGTLQSIFEYQSLMCELTGMDVSNASHYDGATALSEAALMSIRQKKGVVIVPENLHPRYRDVLKTYLGKRYASRLKTIRSKGGMLDIEDIEKEGDIACGIIQSPNFFGVIEDVKAFSEKIHAKGGDVIMVANPMSFGVLESPGVLGADMAVGEAQPLGLPMSCGGETLGFFCVKNTLMRRIPGRVAGMTKDIDGKRGFVLTLQTREQHIRREKATSNICSNQALNALRAMCYLSYLGKKGFFDVSIRNMKNALYLTRLLEKMSVEFLFPNVAFFNEFCIKIPDLHKFFSLCAGKGIHPGVKLDEFFPDYTDFLLVCVTETKTERDLEFFAETLKEYLDGKR